MNTDIPSPCWDFVLFTLAQVVRKLSQLPWVYMCNCTAVSRKQFLCSHPLHLTFTIFSSPHSLITMIPEPWEGSYCIYVLFRAENSSSTYSLHLDQLWVSVLVPTYCKEKVSMMKIERCINYRCYETLLGVSLILFPISRLALLGSPSGSMTHLAIGS